MKHIFVSVLAIVALTISIASVGFAQPPQTPAPGSSPKIENQQAKPDTASAKKADPKKEAELKNKSKAAKQQSDLHWVFLMAGKSTVGLGAEEVDAMLTQQF